MSSASESASASDEAASTWSGSGSHDDNSKTVLVTGGAGFIGSHTAAVLLQRGDKVVVVDEVNDYYDVSMKRSNIDLLRKLSGDNEEQFVFVEGDIADRELMQHSLFLGLAMRPGEQAYAQGDFLVRNVMGGDADSGALWVGARVHPNQVVQFHLRDAATSAADLEQTLARLDTAIGTARPAGGLLFSCMGRGAGLYGVAGHDSSLVHAALGAVPLGGFFCNGEIGEVAGVPFVHGYTSAIALFRPRGDGAPV